MADGEAGIPYGDGGGGKFESYQRSLAQAQANEAAAIQQMLKVNAQNKVMLAQKTWETQYGSCTNAGQKAIFDSFRSEWFSEYQEIGIVDSYEEYVNRWGARASRMSLSAASITAITGQLSIGYAFNVALGFALFDSSYGHSEDQVLQILDYIEKFLGTLSQERGFSARSRNYKGAKFSSARVSGFGDIVYSGLGQSMGGGRISIGVGDAYAGRLRYGNGRGTSYDRNGRRTSERTRGYESAERRAGSRGLGAAEGRAGSAATRRAVKYVLRYGRYFIL